MVHEDWLETALTACREAGRIQRRYFRSASLGVETKNDGSPVTAADREGEEAIRRVLEERTPEMGILGEEQGSQGPENRRWIVDPLDGTKNFVAGIPFFAVLLGLEVDGEIELGVIHAPALGPGGWPESSSCAQEAAGCTWWAVKGRGAYSGTGTLRESRDWKRLRVRRTPDLDQAFVVHGGLRHFQERGLWDGFSRMVAATYRSRGFGDWWGHVLLAEGRCDAMVEAIVAYHDVAALKVLVQEAGGLFLTQGDKPLGPSFEAGVISTTADLGPDLKSLLGF